MINSALQNLLTDKRCCRWNLHGKISARNFWLTFGVTLFCYGSGFGGTGFAEQQTLYDAKGKRDPFVPLVREGRFIGHTATPSAGASSADLLLGGIVWDPTGHSLALINETEVQVGESVSGYRVMEIRPDSVVLVRDGKPVVLQISFEDRVTSHE